MLKQTKKAIEGGNLNFPKLEADAQLELTQSGFLVDYYTIRNPRTLVPASAEDNELVILVTARLGTTRLLDNIEVNTAQR